MNPWLRRLYIILTVGGGFTGVAVTLQVFLSFDESDWMIDVLYLGSIGLYTYGIFAGLRFAENERDKKHLILFYWLQVPWISSPILGYRFTSGFHLSGIFIERDLKGFFRIGSDWQFNIVNTSLPWGIGLNIFALIMVLILIKKTQPNKALDEITESSAPSNSSV